MQNRSNDFAFFPSGKYLLAHPIDINQFIYSIAKLHGRGLRDTNLTRAFGRMLMRKIQERQNGDLTWQLISEKRLSRIDTGHLPEIYNAVYFSIYKSASTN